CLIPWFKTTKMFNVNQSLGRIKCLGIYEKKAPEKEKEEFQDSLAARPVAMSFLCRQLMN
ncbi:hypothetical protein ACQP3C_31070, partial [Escherichia coli]